MGGSLHIDGKKLVLLYLLVLTIISMFATIGVAGTTWYSKSFGGGVTIYTDNGSSGFTTDNTTMAYLIIGAVASISIGIVVYIWPMKKK